MIKFYMDSYILLYKPNIYKLQWIIFRRVVFKNWIVISNRTFIDLHKIKIYEDLHSERKKTETI